MAKDEKILNIEHLSKSFNGKKILDDVSFYVRKGEFITFLGPSGCGKTTLLNIIRGFREADSGKIEYKGKNLDEIPTHQRPFNTVFQRYALFPHLDVYDNVAFGLKLRKTPEKEMDKTVRKMLKLVSMTDYEERDVESLSGGQQQRVAIARALANSPEILLLDEPLSALDLKMRKDMQLELKEIHKKLGITFIYVTHDQEEALTLSDTIVVMNEGRIQQIGSPTDIYNEPCNAFVADFIGESNILNGTMIDDLKAEFIGQEFDCVDEGFGKNVPVDVVLRPEDIYIMNRVEGAQFIGKVTSCTFKGVHYRMFVDTESGYELAIDDYNAFEVGSTVGLFIKPQDIQVMKKDCTTNRFEGKVVDENHVDFLNGNFECKIPEGLTAGDEIIAEVDFDKIDLLDYQEEGELCGEIHSLIYKGNVWHLEITTESGARIFADTQDTWDKGDLLGINIKAKDIKIIRKND